MFRFLLIAATAATLTSFAPQAEAQQRRAWTTGERCLAGARATLRGEFCRRPGAGSSAACRIRFGSPEYDQLTQLAEDCKKRNGRSA